LRTLEPKELQMKVRTAIGAQLINTPDGVRLHCPLEGRQFDGSLLLRPGVLPAISTCATWQDREAVELALAQDGAATREDAGAILDQLLADGVLVADSPDVRQAETALARWTDVGWEEPFAFHWMRRTHQPHTAQARPRKQAHERARIDLRRDAAVPNSPIFNLLTVEEENEWSHADRRIGFDELSWMTFQAYGFLSADPPLTPLAASLLVLDVEDVQPGAYRYDARAHALELIEAGDLRSVVTDHLIRKHDFFQPFTHRLAYIVSAQFDRAVCEEQRTAPSYRSVHHELGRVMEATRLCARALRRNHFRGYAGRESVLEPLLGLDGLDEAAMTYSIIG
jgi:hypothetical protein